MTPKMIKMRDLLNRGISLTPEHDAEHPHVGGAVKRAVGNGLRCHPAHRQQAAARLAKVFVRVLAGTVRAETNFNQARQSVAVDGATRNICARVSRETQAARRGPLCTKRMASR